MHCVNVVVIDPVDSDSGLVTNQMMISPHMSYPCGLIRTKMATLTVTANLHLPLPPHPSLRKFTVLPSFSKPRRLCVMSHGRANFETMPLANLHQVEDDN